MNREPSGVAGVRRRPVRAVSLLSGGLDSQLAICVLREQGIEVTGVVFKSPFFSLDLANRAARQLAVRLEVLDFTADILDLLAHPRHGFGSCLNPCIDCHARMIRRAGEFMQANGMDFISTGEVLNERPMSQNGRTLGVVAEDSGFADWLVRPLSAKRLKETRPEREGLVDRSRLLDLEGRSRKPQFALAVRYGLTDIPTPAGGCRLTEPNFCRRLDDLRKHEGLGSIRDIERLGVGRHFRLADRFKLVLGRDQADNAAIQSMSGPEEYILKPDRSPGPTGWLPAAIPEALLMEAVSICAHYTDRVDERPVPVRVEWAGESRVIESPPMERDAVERRMI